MKLNYPCNTVAHGLARRQFLGTLAAGAGAMVGGLGAFTSQAMAALAVNTSTRGRMALFIGKSPVGGHHVAEAHLGSQARPLRPAGVLAHWPLPTSGCAAGELFSSRPSKERHGARGTVLQAPRQTSATLPVIATPDPERPP